MFFPRLRRQAKWVFVFLAFVFAAGFVFFGVGSGSTGLGDLLRGNFNIFGSGGGSTTSPAVKNALKRTQANPKDPEGWRALATAYSGEGKENKATKANEQLLKLRPNDIQALQSVAVHYDTTFNRKATEYQTLQSQIPISLSTILGVSSATQIGQALSNDPTTQQLTQKSQTAYSDALAALKKELGVYKKLAKLQPSDLNTQVTLARLASQIGDNASAIPAYRRIIKLAKTDPTAAQYAAQARQALKALSATAQR